MLPYSGRRRIGRSQCAAERGAVSEAMKQTQPAAWRWAALPSNWSLADRRGPLGAAILWCLILALAGVIGIAPAITAAAAIVGTVIVAATLIRPALGLALLALAIPFGSARELSLGVASIGMAEALAALVVAAWIARMAALTEVRVERSRLWLPLALLLSAMLVSVTGALSIGYALKELAKWLEFAAVIVCTASLITEKDRWLIVGSALLAGIGAGLLGWYQFLRGVGPEGFLLFGRFMRAYGAFRQPNPYAGYLGMILPIGVALATAYWPWGRGPQRGLRDRLIWLLGCATIATAGPAIIMSWSRGGWFGAAAALLVVALGRGRWQAIGLILVALALAGLVLVTGADQLAPETLVTRLTDFTAYFTLGDVTYLEPNPANWAVLERLAHWQAAQRMFAEHPWLGVGIGNYEPVYPAYRLPRWTDPLGHAHNYYLNIAAEAGVMGLGAYLLFWLAAAWLAWRRVRRTAGIQRGLALGILAAMAHLAVHSIFDNLYVQGIYLQVALWIGLIIPPGGSTQDEITIDVRTDRLGTLHSG